MKNHWEKADIVHDSPVLTCHLLSTFFAYRTFDELLENNKDEIRIVKLTALSRCFVSK